jgi:hypothetical protein
LPTNSAVPKSTRARACFVVEVTMKRRSGASGSI